MTNWLLCSAAYSTEWPTFHLLLYVVAAITAFLTATYMFRLVYMAFHGECRHGTSHDGHSSSHGGHGAAHGGAHLHDAPPSMAFALIVLAIGSVLAGYLGVPHSLGGSNWIEGFLHPSFVPVGAPHEAAEAVHADASMELLLMALSVGLALAGIGIAFYFWLRNPAAATAWSQRFSGIHKLLLNKYYVDEIYDAAIVQPIKGISSLLLWKGMDAALIDGAVNGLGRAVRGSSDALRRLQTGSVRAYAASLFLGVVLILGWYLLR